jgi:hypothetical protein
MPLPARFALALALSLVAAGAVQQAIMAGEHGTLSALPPLAAGVVLISALFALVVWRRGARAAGRTAVVLLSVMLVFGVTIAILGFSTKSPGIGGNIGYGLALIVDFYFLVPAAVAMPIHWLMLHTRG